LLAEGTVIVQAAATAILQVGIRHTFIGDLKIWVGVEGGREVLIWNREGGNARNIFREWNLLQLGFTTNDLPPSESKRWYLKISDEVDWDEGRLEYFRIVYQGQTYESQDHPEIKDRETVWAWIPSRGVPSLPDLTVRDVSFSPQTVTQVESIAVSWTEVNIGSGNAGPYRVGIYLGISEYGRDYPLGSLNRDGLAAGGSRSATQIFFAIPPDVPPGIYYVTVFIDDLGAVSEADENNNVGSSTPRRITVEEREEYLFERLYDLSAVLRASSDHRLFVGIRGSGQPKVHARWDYVLEIEIRSVRTNRVLEDLRGAPKITDGIFYIYADRRSGPNLYPYGATGEDPMGRSVLFYTRRDPWSGAAGWYGLYQFPNLRNQFLTTLATILTIGAEIFGKYICALVLPEICDNPFLEWLLEVLGLRPPSPPEFDPNQYTSWPLPLLYVDKLDVYGYHQWFKLEFVNTGTQTIYVWGYVKVDDKYYEVPVIPIQMYVEP
jgi:hypothetical protein